MAADGSLKFDTKIDTTDFDKSIATLEKALDHFSAAIDRLSEKIVNSFQGAGNAAQDVGQKAQEASKGVDAIGEAAEEAEKKVESLEEQMAKIRVHGLDDGTSTETAPEEPRISMVPEYAMGYDPDVMAFVENWGKTTETAAEQTESLEQAVSEATEVIREFPGTVEPTSGIVGTTMSLIKEAFKQMADQTAQSLKKIPDTAKFALSKAGQITKTFAKALAYPVTSAAKKACTGIKNLINPSKKASNAILKLSNMFKMMLIRMAMKAAIQGAKEGMQNLVQYSKSANQSMSELKSSMLYLQNSFAAAFAPILTFVTPAINTLTNALATAIGYINQFFSALGGASTFTRAKKKQEDYAKSLKKTGSAADSTKKSLAGFDKLTTLNDQNSSGGSSGTDPSEMFETVEISSVIGGFADQIRAAFESGDWKELGTLIGTKFNELVDGVAWSDIGHKIGYGLNGAVQTAYHTLSTIDFTSFGSHVAQMLNGGLSEIDFTFVGRLLTRGFTAGFDFLIGFLGTLDWGLVGRSVGDLLRGSFDEAYEWTSSIDWSQMASDLYDNIKKCLTGVDFASLAESFFKALGGALGASVSFVATVIKKIVEDIAGYFAQYIKDENGDGKFGGKEIINGLYEGIKDAVKNVGTWIKEHVFEPFMEGIKTCFGIHSPSTVMKEIGGYLIEGLKNGIENAVPDLRGVINGIISLLEDALNYIVDGINGLSFDVPDWVPKIGGTTFGFDIRPFHLPRLASGTVVPPRAGEFAAILGDNNRETEVVSPLSTIKQALLEAMREGGLGSGGDIQITLNLDGKTVYDTIVKRNQMTKRQTGKNPLLA